MVGNNDKIAMIPSADNVSQVNRIRNKIFNEFVKVIISLNVDACH